MTPPLPLAAPVWLFHGLLLLTFLLHLIAMNLLAGGALLAGVSRLRRRGNPHAAAFVSAYSTAAPVLFAATVTLGVAPLLFLQVLYGPAFFSSSVVMAWPWLGVVGLVMAAYGAAYAVSWSTRLSPSTKTTLQWTIAGLLLIVAFLYTTNMTLMLSPERVAERYLASGRGLHLNLGEPTLVPRYLHFMLGAIAVGGMGLALAGALARTRAPGFSAWATRHGLLWFAGATAANVLIGVWWLMMLDAQIGTLFMGTDGYATAVIGLATVAGALSLAAAVVSLLKRHTDVWTWIAAVAATLTIAGMVLARDIVRVAALDRAAYLQPANVDPQWVPIGLFVVLLIAALATVAWMVSRLRFSAAPRDIPQSEL
jgi:hypothetical protein